MKAARPQVPRKEHGGVLRKLLPSIAMGEITCRGGSECTCGVSASLDTRTPHARPLPISMPHFGACIFADVRGFSTLSNMLAGEKESQVPGRRDSDDVSSGVEVLTTILNALLDRLTVCVGEFGGDVIKFAGDSIVAVFAAPRGDAGPEEEPPPAAMEAAVTAAVECAAAFAGIVQSVSLSFQSLKLELKMRVGVGAGAFSSVHLGVRTRREFFVAGPAVQQALDAEHHAQPGDIVLSAAALARLPPTVAVPSDPPLALPSTPSTPIAGVPQFSVTPVGVTPSHSPPPGSDLSDGATDSPRFRPVRLLPDRAARALGRHRSLGSAGGPAGLAPSPRGAPVAPSPRRDRPEDWEGGLTPSLPSNGSLASLAPTSSDASDGGGGGGGGVAPAELAEILRAYAPQALLKKLDSGPSAFVAELRRVSVLFVLLQEGDGGPPSARHRRGSHTPSPAPSPRTSEEDPSALSGLSAAGTPTLSPPAGAAGGPHFFSFNNPLPPPALAVEGRRPSLESAPRDSPKIAGKEPEAERLDSLNRIVAISQAAMEQYEGSIRQMMLDDKGLVVICAFGLPFQSHEDDEARAVSAALHIGREIAIATGRAWRPHVGVATGAAFAGFVGSKDRCEYMLVGDSIVVAARLMALAAQRGEALLVDLVTRDALAARPIFLIHEVESALLKGKERAARVFRVCQLGASVSLLARRRSSALPDTPESRLAVAVPQDGARAPPPVPSPRRPSSAGTPAAPSPPEPPGPSPMPSLLSSNGQTVAAMLAARAAVRKQSLAPPPSEPAAAPTLAAPDGALRRSGAATLRSPSMRRRSSVSQSAAAHAALMASLTHPAGERREHAELPAPIAEGPESTSRRPAPPPIALPALEVDGVSVIVPTGPPAAGPRDPVGRSAPLDSFRRLLERLQRDRLSSYFELEADAGLGKSTVVRTIRRIAAHAGATVLVGVGDSIERFAPYAPFRSVLSALVGAGAHPSEARERIERAIMAAGRDELMEVRPLLNAVLPAHFRPSKAVSAMDQRGQSEALRALLAFLICNLEPRTGAARSKPLSSHSVAVLAPGSAAAAAPGSLAEAAAAAAAAAGEGPGGPLKAFFWSGGAGPRAADGPPEGQEKEEPALAPVRSAPAGAEADLKPAPSAPPRIGAAHPSVSASVGHPAKTPPGSPPKAGALVPPRLSPLYASEPLSSRQHPPPLAHTPARLTTSVGTASPLVLIIDDAQWVDSASWALLASLEYARRPILLVVAYRPFATGSKEGAEPHGEGDGGVALPPDLLRLRQHPALLGERHALAPLSEADMAALLADLCEVDEVPMALVRYVQEASHGNPLWATEVLHQLAHEELVQLEEAPTARPAADGTPDGGLTPGLTPATSAEDRHSPHGSGSVGPGSTGSAGETPAPAAAASAAAAGGGRRLVAAALLRSASGGESASASAEGGPSSRPTIRRLAVVDNFAERVRRAVVPHKLNTLIVSRMDALAPPEQLMLKVAAVLGRTFARSTLIGVYAAVVRADDEDSGGEAGGGGAGENSKAGEKTPRVTPRGTPRKATHRGETTTSGAEGGGESDSASSASSVGRAAVAIARSVSSGKGTLRRRRASLSSSEGSEGEAVAPFLPERDVRALGEEMLRTLEEQDFILPLGSSAAGELSEEEEAGAEGGRGPEHKAPEGGQLLQFKHALVVDACYSCMVLRQKQRLHAIAGGWLEGDIARRVRAARRGSRKPSAQASAAAIFFGGARAGGSSTYAGGTQGSLVGGDGEMNPAAVAAVLAHHFSKAGPEHRPRALFYVERAGQSALQQQALPDALALYRRLVAMCTAGEGEAKGKEAEAWYREAELAKAGVDKTRLGVWCRVVAELELESSRHHQAETFALRALACLEGGDVAADGRSALRVLAEAGTHAWRRAGHALRSVFGGGPAGAGPPPPPELDPPPPRSDSADRRNSNWASLAAAQRRISTASSLSAAASASTRRGSAASGPASVRRCGAFCCFAPDAARPAPESAAGLRGSRRSSTTSTASSVRMGSAPALYLDTAPSGSRRDRNKEDPELERVRAYIILCDVFWNRAEGLPLAYANLRAVNIAEDYAEKRPGSPFWGNELPKVFASMAYGHHARGWHGAADHYVRRALECVPFAADPLVQADILSLVGGIMLLAPEPDLEEALRLEREAALGVEAYSLGAFSPSAAAAGVASRSRVAARAVAIQTEILTVQGRLREVASVAEDYLGQAGLAVGEDGAPAGPPAAPLGPRTESADTLVVLAVHAHALRMRGLVLPARAACERALQIGAVGGPEAGLEELPGPLRVAILGRTAAVLWDGQDRDRSVRYARLAVDAARASGPAFLPFALDGYRGAFLALWKAACRTLAAGRCLRLPGAGEAGAGRRAALAPFLAPCEELAARVRAWAEKQRYVRHAALRMDGELALLRGDVQKAAGLLEEGAAEARDRRFPLDEAFCLLRACQARAAGPDPPAAIALDAALRAPEGLFEAAGCALGVSLVRRLRSGQTLL